MVFKITFKDKQPTYAEAFPELDFTTFQQEFVSNSLDISNADYLFVEAENEQEAISKAMELRANFSKS